MGAEMRPISLVSQFENVANLKRYREASSKRGGWWVKLDRVFWNQTDHPVSRHGGFAAFLSSARSAPPGQAQLSKLANEKSLKPRKVEKVSQASVLPLLARRGGSSGLRKAAKRPCRETGWWVKFKKFLDCDGPTTQSALLRLLREIFFGRRQPSWPKGRGQTFSGSTTDNDFRLKNLLVWTAPPGQVGQDAPPCL